MDNRKLEGGELKGLFIHIKHLASKYCLVQGYGEIRNKDSVPMFKNPSWDNMGITFGFADENLVLQAFEDYECCVKTGDYTFSALLSHHKAQVGDYPPPNIEVPEYWMIEHIEYQNVNPPEE